MVSNFKVNGTLLLDSDDLFFLPQIRNSSVDQAGCKWGY